MFRVLVGGVILVALSVDVAKAGTCPAYPTTLANGTTADANQVMGNFNSILGCANTNLAPVANPSFTGKVGVGTSSPQQALDVNGSALFGNQTERTAQSSISMNFNILGGSVFDSTINAFSWQHSGNASANSDYLTLKSFNGIGSVIASRLLTFNASGSIGVESVPNTNYTFYINGAPLGLSYALYVNGAAGGTTGWTNASDERLKKHIVQISGALDLVERLRGVRFEWKSPGERDVGKALDLPINEPQVGFIAQEVAPVVPEAVVSPKPGSDQIYGLKQENLVPVLVEAIKEQQVEIERLRSQIAALAAVKSR